MLIKILIVFFVLLLVYQIFTAIYGANLVEGIDDTLSYKNYDTNNPNNPNSALILSQQNAGNISYLKQRIDDLMDLKGSVMDLCGNVVQLNQQVHSLVQQQADAMTQLVGDKPVKITGA